MGNLAYYAGFGSDIFQTARYWVGRIPGGLAQSVVAGCTAFGTCCGSGLATCAMMSKIAIPEMLKAGYDPKLSFGAVAAAGPIAAMIPPSILMVIYGIITEQPIGKLLIAGILPGLVTAANFMLLIYIWARLKPTAAPRMREVTWGERLGSLKYGWTVLLLAVIIMGGIYSGIFTPTEAGGVSMFAALALGLVLRRLRPGNVAQSLSDTMKTTGMVFLIMAGAYIFGTLLAVTQLPTKLSQSLVGLQVPPFVVLASVMVLYLILGTFLDMIAAMFLTLPIIFPAIVSLGYDPIWFGVLMVHQCELCLITPPYALNLFVIKGIVPGAQMGDLIKGVGLFVLADIVTLAILIAFPQISLFLPSKMMG